ncbi:MAG: nuclear transport factor 2 family protein [Opitutus sp.]
MKYTSARVGGWHPSAIDAGEKNGKPLNHYLLGATTHGRENLPNGQPILAKPRTRTSVVGRVRTKQFGGFFLLLTTTWASLLAAERDLFTAARVADEQRVAATVAGDTATLESLLSDDLRYANADGRVQTKAELLAATRANTITFVSVSSHDVGFQMISPTAVAMSGVTRVSARVNNQAVELRLRFLAVWREEAGHWKLLAYQSSQLPGS